jgi:glutathione S-transferase
MSEFVLYGAPQSTCSQRVRFVLNAKALAFEEHQLDLFAGDQLKPEYLAINPNGVVPALLHAGRPVTDSAVIIEYLDEIRPDGACFTPEDPVERAGMRAMMRYIDEIPTPAIRVPSYNLAFLPHFQKMTEAEFVALAHSKPLRKEFLLTMGRAGFPQAEMDQALDRLSRAVARMAQWLDESGGPWLMGARMTLADVAIMPVIVRMDDINLHGLWRAAPSLQRWLDLVRAQAAFAPTYYFGSLLTEKYPHLIELRRHRVAAAQA